mmetsp:Transcript_1781/g.5514  ORF Transcript_1781/g.5514 Transcript_1781/m.5514 type:complete len:91 (-) Transcript_1781:486-758(-)
MGLYFSSAGALAPTRPHNQIFRARYCHGSHTRAGSNWQRMNFEIYARDFEDVFPSIEDVLMAYTPADMTYNVARQCVSHPNGCKPAASRW